MKRAWKGLFRKGEANVVKIVCLSVGLAIGLVMLAGHAGGGHFRTVVR